MSAGAWKTYRVVVEVRARGKFSERQLVKMVRDSINGGPVLDTPLSLPPENGGANLYVKGYERLHRDVVKDPELARRANILSRLERVEKRCKDLDERVEKLEEQPQSFYAGER